MRHTCPIPRTPGTVSSAAKLRATGACIPRGTCSGCASHEPRPPGADEHPAFEARERNPLGPAARPADGIERLFASTTGAGAPRPCAS